MKREKIAQNKAKWDKREAENIRYEIMFPVNKTCYDKCKRKSKVSKKVKGKSIF